MMPLGTVNRDLIMVISRSTMMPLATVQTS